MLARKRIALSLLLIFAAVFLFAIQPVESAVPQTVTFINVGQGDAALLRDGAGFDVLIDGGRTSAGPAVLDALRAQGVADLDVLVATHADADHVGGLIDVLEADDIPVLSVIYNGYPGATATWSAFADAVTQEGLTLTPAQFPQELDWGEMRVYVLNPAGGLGNPETNTASLVLRVDHGSVRYLFTGDIDAAVEAAVVARQTPIAANVLKVAHHGSKYSSSADFLAAAGAQESVISVGNNSYGHPAPETLDRLAAAGSRVWRTDIHGNIRVESDGAAYLVIPQVVWNTIFLPFINADQ
jgi:competence protein ComEC